MITAEQKLAAIYENGGKPTMDDMENALQEVLKDRNALASMSRSMGGWLARLVLAHGRQDGEAIAAILEEFIAKHVAVAGQSNGQVH